MNEWANAVLQTCQNDGQPDSYSWVKYAKMALANEGKYIDLDHSANPFAPQLFRCNGFRVHGYQLARRVVRQFLFYAT